MYFLVKIFIILYTFNPRYKGDVPYVPTSKAQRKRAFELLDIKESDTVVDLGSGDGDFLIYAASKTKALYTGIEINRFLYIVSQIKSKFVNKKGILLFKCKSFWDEDLSLYSKIFMYSMPTFLKKYVTKMEKELQPGTRVASIIFPIESKKLKLKGSYGTQDKVFLYEVQ